MEQEPPTTDAQGPEGLDPAELVKAAAAALEERLKRTPPDWKPALTAVLNCYGACAMHIASFQGVFHPQDAIALTRMVLEQKARDDARADAAEKARTEEGDQ